MSTRQTTPSSSLAVLAPTNSLKRALSEDADSDTHPDPKKIKLKSENTPQGKDKKKRKKKKKKTPVVVPLELPGGSTNTTMPPAVNIVLSVAPAPLRTLMAAGKGKRKATSAPPTSAKPPASAIETISADQESEKATETPKEPPRISDLVESSSPAESSSATIARLNQELSAQSAALKKHESALSHFTQSLTCQICLDLLHKPYALAPCGHIACYNCLVAWFTSANEAQEYYIGPRKKTCPHCRATIKERPVEVWNIKDLVASLLRSGLVSGLSPGSPPPPPLPGTPQPVDAATTPDPWHNIFRHSHQHPRFHPPAANGEPPSVEDMGMLDMEDGGVYRCLDCMHEIWDGICTACNRVYPGHQVDTPFGEGEMFDDSDGDEEPHFWPHFAGPFEGEVLMPIPGTWWNESGDEDEESEAHDAEDGYDSFIDDDDEGHAAAAIIEIDDSDSEHDNTPRRTHHGRRAAPVNRRIAILSSDDEDEEDVRPRRRGTRNRIASPVGTDDVIVVSDDDAPPRATVPLSRFAQLLVRHQPDEDRFQEISDNESTASSRHAERSPEPLTAAELMNLMRRLQGPNAGHAEDLDEEDFDGHEQEHEHEHDQGYEHADSGDDQGQSYSDGEW